MEPDFWNSHSLYWVLRPLLYAPGRTGFPSGRVRIRSGEGEAGGKDESRLPRSASTVWGEGGRA